MNDVCNKRLVLAKAIIIDIISLLRLDSSAVEHFHGKEGVPSSSLGRGSKIMQNMAFGPYFYVKFLKNTKTSSMLVFVLVLGEGVEPPKTNVV